MRVLICILLLAWVIPSYALTVSEEGYLKYTYQLEKLRKERNDLLSQRDAELTAEDSKSKAAQQIISDNYQTLIDTKQGEIDAAQDSLNILIP